MRKVINIVFIVTYIMFVLVFIMVSLWPFVVAFSAGIIAHTVLLILSIREGV